MRLSLLALALGAGLLVAAGFAKPATRGARKEGGTLHLNVSTTDVQFTDAALDYEVIGWQIEFATCAKLLNYPDKPAPLGSRLVPEVAAGFPRVSSDGRTYTFTIRSGFRFSNGAPVTAASFAYAINRNLNPRMASPAVSFLKDVVGAEAVLAKKATAASGVKVRGNTLTIRLTGIAPDFLARIAMNFFCAIPTDLPIDPNGVETPPSAGPYYVAQRVKDRIVVLKRNPFYRGSRPHHLDEIDITVNTNINQSLLQVKKGEVDYDMFGLPAQANAELARRYGVNKGRYFVHPISGVNYIALNTSRPPFNDVSMRKAVNFAIDRPALLLQAGFLAGKASDQILPPTMRGFRDARIYPLPRPDFERAKALAGAGGKATLYATNDPVGTAQSQIVQADLKRIGIEVSVKRLPFAVLVNKTGMRTEPYDMVMIGWFADYLDPYDFINILLYGKNIPAENNVNLAQFDDPAFNRRMEQAARLSGPARYAAYGRLDVDIMRNAAPWASVSYPTVREFVSARVGCYLFQPAFGAMDLAAACLK